MPTVLEPQSKSRPKQRTMRREESRNRQTKTTTHSSDAKPRRRRSGNGLHTSPEHSQRPYSSNAQTTGLSAARRRRKPRSAVARFLSGPISIEKAFTVFSVLVATGIFVLCALDLAIAWPWMQASRLFDWTFLFCGIVLLGLAFDVFKDQAVIRRKRRRAATTNHFTNPQGEIQ